MRVQVEVSTTIKAAAEAEAQEMGYPSLAIMLRVITNGLARDYLATKQAVGPKQFLNWPEHIRRDLATVDPALYRFYIENGIIN